MTFDAIFRDNKIGKSYPGTCFTCKKPFKNGDKIHVQKRQFSQTTRVHHKECWEAKFIDI